MQFYYSDSEVDQAVVSWIDLREGGRIVQKFYDSTDRTNHTNPSLDQFELAQVEDYKGDIFRWWDVPLEGALPAFRKAASRHEIDQTLRRISLAEAYFKPLIAQEETLYREQNRRPRPSWDLQSLGEMKQFLEDPGSSGSSRMWKDRSGFSIEIKANPDGLIEWMKHFYDEELAFSGSVYEVNSFPELVTDIKTSQ